VVNVLRGSTSEQVSARRHDALSTFGLLREATAGEVRGYIEQLIGQGLLEQTDTEFPVLVLAARGLALLRDEGAAPGLTLVRQKVQRRDALRPASRVESESWEGVDRELFERLRTVRLETARARGVPPYVIFHDATLRDMARLRPTTVDALLAVRGVGARKAEDLGNVFLSAIRAHGSSVGDP
jgi:ATP-dependent DNA helicase RecQ